MIGNDATKERLRKWARAFNNEPQRLIADAKNDDS